MRVASYAAAQAWLMMSVALFATGHPWAGIVSLAPGLGIGWMVAQPLVLRRVEADERERRAA